MPLGTLRLFYFRPGEEARMLARCQFGIAPDGNCGATLTYPIKGHAWRRNPSRDYAFEISDQTKSQLFADVARIREEFPADCLSQSELWADSAEQANSITRDRATGKLCYTIGLYRSNNETEDYYSLREDSPALLSSTLYRVISELIEPYEKL
jgi:hypothetical protein